MKVNQYELVLSENIHRGENKHYEVYTYKTLLKCKGCGIILMISASTKEFS